MATEAATTAIELLASYDARQFNVITPIVLTDGRQSPFLAESVSVVHIHAGSGDTYNDFRFAKQEDNKFALSGLALTKLVNAAGGKWVPGLTDVLDQGSDMQNVGPRPFLHKWIRYQAAVAIRQQNGEWHVELGQKELDTRVIAEELYDEKLRSLERTQKAGYRGKRLYYSKEDIPDLVLRDLLRIRNDLLPLAESKAKNRAIRRVLTLEQVYTKDALDKPFAIPVLVYRPDLSDPMELERVQVDGAKAAASIFGAPDPGHGNTGSGTEVRPSPGALAASGSLRPQEAGPVEGRSGAGVTEGTSRAESPTAGTAPRSGHGSHEGVSETPAPDQPSPPVGDQAVSGSAAVGTLSSEPEPEGNLPFKRPEQDPEIQDAPYKGKRYSEIAGEDPGFLQGMAAKTRVRSKKRLIDEWLLWATGLDSTGEKP